MKQLLLMILMSILKQMSCVICIERLFSYLYHSNNVWNFFERGSSWLNRREWTIDNEWSWKCPIYRVFKTWKLMNYYNVFLILIQLIQFDFFGVKIWFFTSLTLACLYTNLTSVEVGVKWLKANLVFNDECMKIVSFL